MNMEKNQPYDPEDIESLMMHKSFTDLYPEEKEFVLRHMDSEKEYESMRKTLNAIVSDNSSEPLLKAPSRLKKNLMAEFDQEQKGSWIIWLNTFKGMLWPQDVFLALRPMIIVPALLLCGGLLWWYTVDSNNADLLAELREPTKVSERVPAAEEESMAELDLSSAVRPTPDVKEEIVESLEAVNQLDQVGKNSKQAELESVVEEEEVFIAVMPEDLPKPESKIAVDAARNEVSKARIAEDVAIMNDAEEEMSFDFTAPVSSGTITLDSTMQLEQVYASPSSVQHTALQVSEIQVLSKDGNLFNPTVSPIEAASNQNVQKDKAILGLLYTAY